MNLLVIKDDKPGHYNQTEGLILELKEIYPNMHIDYIDIKIKSKLTRKILRFSLNTFDSFFQKKENLKYLSFFYKEFSLPSKKPDLIISTGGNTSNLNAWLGLAYDSKNILNGALRGLKEELFTYVTTVIDLGYKNQIILDVAPSIITKEKLEESVQKFINEKKLDPNKTYYSLLVGGNGSGYTYDDNFYNKLIELIKNISIKENVSWLITTSRRTPFDIEMKLKEELINYSSYFVAYNSKEEKILLPFLALSDKVFVTEESASMISESISSHKYVITISNIDTIEDRNYSRIIDKFVDKSFIQRININKNLNDDILVNKNIIKIEKQLIKALTNK